MFEDPAVKPLIESAGHIYDSTVISRTFKKATNQILSSSTSWKVEIMLHSSENQKDL